jgi:hypothetical protein
MSLDFNCTYMAMSSLTYIPGFSMNLFFQPMYTNYANLAYIEKSSHLNLLLLTCWTRFVGDGPWIVSEHPPSIQDDDC